MTHPIHPITVKNLGMRDYTDVWQAMKTYNAKRSTQNREDTEDQLWLVEHPSVFTLGLNGKQEHILNAGDIPVVQCDRGGQVTYHGPGQIVCYTLLDLERRHLGVKQLVQLLEQSVINVLDDYHIKGERKEGAPGIYVSGAKIAALGLRIRRGCSYHGLSLNVDMDLEPFTRINPCGYEGLEACQLVDLVKNPDMDVVAQQLVQQIQTQLS